MSDQAQFWSFIGSRLRRGEPVVLLVVAESGGSSPGRSGFKMAVAADAMTGSIGGGVMEVGLVEAAREALRDPAGFGIVRELVHRANVPNSSGMICSGRQKVIIIRLDASSLETVDSITSAIRENQRAAVEITPEGISMVNELPDSAIEFRQQDPDQFIFRESLGRHDRIFIIGGGHCALALSELMSKLGFRISLFDDRADLNTIEKNTFADEKTIVGSYDEIAAHIPEGDDVFVVVMTLGYRFDEMVIRRLLGKRSRYFGVLGSRAKMATLIGSLKEEGFDEHLLAAIRTPIGIPIRSRTPEEIAVSIAAEIISVRNHPTMDP